MYRRRIKKAPTPVFGDTLEEFGFTINEQGHLIDKEGKRYAFDLKAKDRDYQEAHGRALSAAAMNVMLKRMEDECDLVKATVPLGIKGTDTTSPRAHILLSSNAKEAQRLLVLVPGTVESLGMWSRRLLSNYSVEIGSMLTTVKQAHAEGYGIAILNPNAHWWVDGRESVLVPTKKDYAIIPHLESPEVHVDYVFRNFIQNFASKEIFIMAHKYGAHALITALHTQFDFFKDRVAAIAVIDGTHTIDSVPEPMFQKWWSLNAAGFIQSKVEEKGMVEYRDHAGCNCVKAGTEEFDFTLVDEMPSIFRFFRARWGRDNTFARNKDLLQPLNPDDPTTAMITFQDVPEEDEEEVEAEVEVEVNAEESSEAAVVEL